MKLEKWHLKLKKREKILFLGGFMITFLLGIVLFKTFALYEIQKDWNVMQGNIPNQNYDLQVAVTLDGTSISHFPSKNQEQAIESIQCDKGAKGVWDYEKWRLNVQDIQETRTKCQVNFITKYQDTVL